MMTTTTATSVLIYSFILKQAIKPLNISSGDSLQSFTCYIARSSIHRIHTARPKFSPISPYGQPLWRHKSLRKIENALKKLRMIINT